jgi:hypothetical protein
MDITFRTLGAWGAGKGSNLEASEVDTNFWSLAEAIIALQNNPPLPVGIALVTVTGTQMTITLTDGTVMGPFVLPVLTFRWRGEYDGATLYAALDVFTVSTGNPWIVPETVRYGIFMVQIAGTYSNFDPDAAVSGAPAFLQLFGSVDTLLRTLGDVTIDNMPDPVGQPGAPFDGSVLIWHSDDQHWHDQTLGDMAFQPSNGVFITGGQIRGMSAPIDPQDVATKAYVDALPAGMTAPDGSMMANIAGSTAPAIPNTLSDYLDYALGTTTRGALLYRGGPGWIALPPGTDGLFLQTHAAGADPTWAIGASGVVSIDAGTGLDTGGAPITSTGVISLASAADSRLLANISGGSAIPTPQTLSAILDHILTNARGTVLVRNISGWVGLPPGTNGYYLKTQGAGADLLWDAPVGSGTLTSISAGAGISTGGAPITATGVVSLDTIASAAILANNTGATAVPTGVSLTLLLDRVLSTTQGAVMYRSATTWVALTPGTSGQILTTGGAASNPSWANAPTTGGSVPNGRIISNISGSSAVPSGNTLSNILDSIISSNRGTLLYRTNSGWVGLAPGTSGQVLTTGGSAADPSWLTNAGASIAIATPHAQDTLSYNTSSGKFENVRPRYIVAAYAAGTMVGASQNLLFHKFSKAVTVPANLGAYLGHTTEAGGATAATGSTAIILARALAATPTTFATVATITFAAGSATGSMSTQAAISFSQGDVLRLRGPASPDPTFSDFHLSLVGFET